MKRTAIVLALAALSSPAFGAVIFQDNFESGLSPANWLIIGSAQTVADPLGPGNTVLNFTAPGSGGDLFSVVIPVGAATYLLEFDYLSIADANTYPTPGGFVGINDPLETWLVGDSNYPATLTTNALPRNNWQHVALTFSTFGNFQLKLEQYVPSGNAPIGTAYFDNVTISETPEPSTFIMVGLALSGFGVWRKSRANNKA